MAGHGTSVEGLVILRNAVVGKLIQLHSTLNTMNKDDKVIYKVISMYELQ